MAWPCSPVTFPDLALARRAYAEVARAIARFEPVVMVANPEDVADAARHCGDAAEIVPLAIDDSWTRDTGPTWLLDARGGLGAVDWRFNNYGEIDPVYANDRLLAHRILERSGGRRFEAPITLEGGAIHTDGRGTLLTTESVVLDPRRNPGVTKADAEEIFRAFLGVTEVIWLDRALEVDPTGGHVDNLACFVQPGVVVALVAEDPADPHHAPLRDNVDRLARARDAAGRPLEVVEIRQPARREFAGERVPASYVNFYIGNGCVVVPTFDDPADRDAVDTLRKVFPERSVVPVPGFDIARSGGCIHCITQQEPRP